MVKQNVSAPIAAIAILVVIVASISLFSRPNAATSPAEKTFVLPYEPPVDDNQLQALHQALGPLGIACVMMPLATDRFGGARVAIVAPGSPADRAGMKAGDLVTKFDSLDITNPFAIGAAMERVDPKKPATVIVVRGKKELKLSITGLKPALS